MLGWCPLVAIAALVLGGVALHRISRSAGTRQGHRLALAGMAIATVILVAEGWLLGRLQSEVQDSMESQAIAAIESSITPLPEAAPAWDQSGRPPTPEAIAAFAKAVATRVGAVTSVTITKRTAEGLAAPVISTAFNAACDRGTVFGNATFGVVPATLPPTLVLRSIEVDVAGERLALAGGPAETGARAGEGGELP